MCLIKSFNGLKGYKDWESVKDVLSYALNSQYCLGYVTGNIVASNDVNSIISQFYQVDLMKPGMENKKKIHHFEVSFKDVDLSEEAVVNLMELIKNYFKKRHFQVVVVRHYRSKSQAYNPHLHVVVNHCNLKGNLWYGNDVQYIELRDYLERATHYPWRYVYGQMDDYESKLFQM